jgi:hypothetical protein
MSSIGHCSGKVPHYTTPRHHQFQIETDDLVKMAAQNQARVFFKTESALCLEKRLMIVAIK